MPDICVRRPSALHLDAEHTASVEEWQSAVTHGPCAHLPMLPDASVYATENTVAYPRVTGALLMKGGGLPLNRYDGVKYCTLYSPVGSLPATIT